MNFKILTVNGQDLSGASHEEAAVALERAPEPITVVLARSGGKKSSSDAINSNSHRRTEGNGRISISTQTQNETCFCRFLLENSNDISGPLSRSILSELTRYRDSQADSELYLANDAEVHDDQFPPEDENEYCNIDCEEITLNLPFGEEKLGIVLFDHTDAFTNQVKVIVTDVTADSIAARCQKIREGDQIIKIDGEPVNCMNDASRLLEGSSQTISLLIGHPHNLDGDTWLDEDKALFVDGLDNDDVLYDVTNCMQSPTSRVTSDESRPKCIEHLPQNNLTKYAGIKSPKIPCGANGTTESVSHSSTGSSSQTGKDSGIGHTLDSSVQSPSDNCNRIISDARAFGTGSSQESKNSHAVAREFTYIQPQNYRFKKHATPSKHRITTEASSDFAKGSVEKSTSTRNNTEFQKLTDAIQNMELENNKKNPRVYRKSSSEVFADGAEDAMSPWVRIARQEYEEKIRQVKRSLDLRSIHPAMASSNVADFDTLMAAMSSSRTPSDATDNTSSAYSTGESFRSSSTTSAPHLGHELISPGQGDQKPKPQRCGVTMTYYMSSDANSDGEGPACYLTHAEDSESEGFEDAGVEFSSTFHSAPSAPYHPVPLPRLLHPPCETVNFISNSLTASTKQLWKAAAAVARNRRQPNVIQQSHQHAIVDQTKAARSNCQSQPDRRRPCSRSTTTSSKERSESETIVPANCQHSGEETTSTKVVDESDTHLNKSSLEVTETKLTHCADKFIGPRVRRSSEHGRSNKKHAQTQRSVSCNDPPEFGKQRSSKTDDKTNADVPMEWKVRVSRDGTRYITKRPVREKVLRHREKRILAERCGITTDDDVTELKLGRHWSRDDRKRHLRHAREKKRRRDFMQQCRLEVLNENTSADGDIVELCHKKMTKQKHKRMLLDDFVTVQEILAHGDRSSDITRLNPLLSVTYI